MTFWKPVGLAEEPDLTVIDSFEDGNLSEWQGLEAGHSAATDQAFKGTYSLKLAENNYARISSTSGLPNYFSKGNICRAHLRANVDAGYSGFLFGYGDANNFFSVWLTWDTNGVTIRQHDAGVTTTVTQQTFVTGLGTANKWYEVRIKWDDGTLGGADGDITVEVRDPASNRDILWTYSFNSAANGANSGIGHETNQFDLAGRANWMDYIVLENNPGVGGPQTVNPNVATVSATAPQTNAGGGLLIANADVASAALTDNNCGASIAGQTTFTTIDDFEDGNLTEYGWGGGQISSTVAYEGTNSFMRDGGGFEETVSTTGLPKYFEKGEICRSYHRANATVGYSGFVFGASDDQNFYWARVGWFSGGFTAGKQVNGIYTNLADDPFTFDNNAQLNNWVEVRVKWDDGTLGGANGDITAELIADPAGARTVLSTLTFNDTDAALQSNTGIGHVTNGFSSAGQRNYMDNVIIETNAGQTGIINPNVANASLTALPCGATNSGAGTIIVDDFETQGNWTWSVVDASLETPGAAVNGTNILKAPTGNFQGDAVQTPNGANFSYGDQSRVYFYFDDGGVLRLTWGLNVANNDGYRIEVGTGAGNLQMERLDAGVNTDLATTTISAIPTGQWNYAEIEWDDGTLGGVAGDMTVTFYNGSTDAVLGSITANDTTYSGAGQDGIGFYTSGLAGNAFFDYWYKF